MDLTDNAALIAPHQAVDVVDLAGGCTAAATTIDEALIGRLHAALDAAQARPECRILLLASTTPGVFSTGMNLSAAGAGTDAEARRTGGAFFDLLKRFTLAPLTVAAAVEGRVAGGGVGLVAACDFVVATAPSTFGLPEALWGLLPCCVLPFLARRTGFQRAYSMTLTTRPIDSAAAAACGLVDEVAGNPAAAVRRLALRADKIDTATVAALKGYAHDLWPLSEQARDLAVGELGRLMALPEVRRRMAGYAADGRFPWER